MWKKDGLRINSTDHHYTELSGKLIIAPAERNHSGAYVCVARNTAGFYCRAKGDPPPSVAWSREQGPLPNGRYLINPDQTLQIHYVTAEDAGKYTCTAVNDVGVVSASAQLLVEDASSTTQRDLHKELSALRVALENVSIVAPGSNISQVQWKQLQSLPAQPHYLDGFEVLYRSLLPASSDWAANKVTVPSFQAQVGPLKRGYKYEFKVLPGASPVSITVSHEQNNTIHVSWEPPPHETHNGIIQGYQVWCVESEEQQNQNWTVDSGHHTLEISTLKPGRRYWITIAAVNGAGVGMLRNPHGFYPQIGAPPGSNSDRGELSEVLALLQDPVLIGSVGALLWFLLMVAAVYLFKRLHRLAGWQPQTPLDLWGWRPAFSQKYQDLWAQGQRHPGIRGASLPVSWKDPRCMDSAVPIVTDSCGVYGTFYVDLMGNGLKTFNSPGSRPKAPHGVPLQQGETIQIFSQPLAKSASLGSREALSWKQAIRPQPRMGVLREKTHSKQGARPAPPVCSDRDSVTSQQPGTSGIKLLAVLDCRITLHPYT
ncbi:hypothetical protein F7725_007384 [Dissostichus mawsoni]|uniref:Uncharacterized protein n=1 Tax=Dissostichus mawsoni TaxID=36200 RepID=A0A7J5XWP3_DISMA|nr:hypothetical protein F7725_007384 [Dissostichus mawsoni]